MLPFLTQWQSVVVNGSIQYRKSWTNRHSTSTSHKYLFSTFLPASAFIYWLFLVTLYDWVEIADTQKEHKRNESACRWQDIKRKGYLNGGTFSCLLLHSTRATFTHYPDSQSLLWAFFLIWRITDGRREKGKLSKRKKREAKLSSQGHHLKKQNKK